MRSIILGLIAGLTFGTGVASAQSVEIGPGGVRLRDRDRYEDDYRYRSRRGYREDFRTGTIGPRCRTVIVREEDEDGDVVTRRVRRCR